MREQYDYNTYNLSVATFRPPPTFRTNVKPKRGGGRYNDAWYTEYRNYIRNAARANGWDKCLNEGNIGFRLTIYWKQPKKLTGVRKVFADPTTGHQGYIPMCVRPDIDNLTKPYMDALEGIAYQDDGQINYLHTSKQYLGPGEQMYFVICEVSGYGLWEDNCYATGLQQEDTNSKDGWFASVGGEEITVSTGKRTVFPSDAYPE